MMNGTPSKRRWSTQALFFRLLIVQAVSVATSTTPSQSPTCRSSNSEDYGDAEVFPCPFPTEAPTEAPTENPNIEFLCDKEEVNQEQDASLQGFRLKFSYESDVIDNSDTAFIRWNEKITMNILSENDNVCTSKTPLRRMRGRRNLQIYKQHNVLKKRRLGFTGADSGNLDVVSLGACEATSEGALGCIVVDSDIMMYFTLNTSDQERMDTLEKTLTAIKESMDNGVYISQSDMPNQVATRYIGPLASASSDQILEIVPPTSNDGSAPNPLAIAGASVAGVGVVVTAMLTTKWAKHRHIREDTNIAESTEL